MRYEGPCWNISGMSARCGKYLAGETFLETGCKAGWPTPGEYQVKMNVRGKIYSETITIRRDPKLNGW